MNILFVLENYLPHIGGVEVVFKNLSEGLVRLGHDVSIITHRLKGTKRFEIINGAKVYRINCFHSRIITFLNKLGSSCNVCVTKMYNSNWFIH